MLSLVPRRRARHSSLSQVLVALAKLPASLLGGIPVERVQPDHGEDIADSVRSIVTCLQL